ncbi:MAG: hypothetical protein EOP07_09155 [Proteobacteria bacterium]|nr:MAG: hypothetical protein EOP07_09155 [Pseudomonadota bacterium]
MENTSDLEQLNRYLKAAQHSYDIPPLESDTPAPSLLSQFVDKITEMLRNLFPKNAQTLDAETLKTVVIGLLSAVVVILIVASVIWVYRYWSSRSKTSDALPWSPAAAVGSADDQVIQPQDLSLAAWVRLRWKLFLERKNLAPSMTPAEALHKIGAADPRLILKLNEGMFWGKTPSLSQSQWESEFEGLEKGNGQ